MKLFNAQRSSVRESNCRLNIWEGAVRSGKTHASVIRWIKYIAEAPPGELILVGKTDRSLKRNIIGPMQMLLGNKMQYYSGKGEINLWDRLIYVVGANDERAEGKIRGGTFSGAYGDELTLWPQSFWNMLLSRLSVKGAQLFGSTNPDSPYHWLKTDVLDRQDQLDLQVFKFVLSDNESLDQKYVNSLKAEYTGLWYKRFIQGLWVLAEGAIYDFFEEKKPYVIDENPIPEYYSVGVDYGTKNPCVFCRFGNNPKTKPMIWAEEEYYYSSKVTGRQKTDSEYADDFMIFIEGKKRPREVFIDPSAASFIVELRRRGVVGIKEVDNSVIDGIRTVARMLKKGDFGINRVCKNYIKEFGAYVWDERAQRRGEDKPIKQSDHCQDQGRYVLHTKFGTQTYNLENLVTF